MAAPKIKLNNGLEIPALGLGTYLDSEIGRVRQAVEDAIDAGYRHFDCAFFYGNESEVGQAIKKKIDEGVVKREDLYIVSKLWNNTHSTHLVVPTIKKSLANLGIDYLDLYLVHWPFAYKETDELLPKGPDGKLQFSDVDYLDAWKGMEECVKLGLTKSIGLSNFNTEQVDRVLSVATIKPVCNQVECSPYLNQKKFIQFCKEREILIVGFAPLSRPDVDEPGKPKPAFEDPRVIAIAKKYNKAPSQVVLRYLHENGVIPIPKSITKSRIASNIDIFDFKMTEEDRKVIDELNNNFRTCPLHDHADHKYFPFKLEY